VRILVRGNHEDHSPGIWAQNRAVQDALEGAAAFAAGEEAEARAHFARAAARAPHDPNALNGIAWNRALARYALEQAEAEANRATRLESRVEQRPVANAADTLAYILLLRGRPREGLAVLLPRMRESGAIKNGLLHYHLAQLHAAAGRLRSSRDALLNALTWDRALARNVEADPFLKPLLEKLPFEQIQTLAARRRFEKQLP
jgi:Flp pilus assembly protein TadD